MCRLSCFFPGNNPRWAKTVVPQINTSVQVAGSCSALSAAGVLQIAIDSIMFGASKGAPPSASITSPDASPSKRKRYGPRGVK